MPLITTLFWDVGGVLLTNAWDHTERAQAIAKFQLDAGEFEKRHQPLADPFEKGEISLDQYLDRTIFYVPRNFSREEFKDCIFSLSQPLNDRLELVRELAKSKKYLMGTINNESRELNAYRIQAFGLREIFSAFVSSCFVGLRKPDEKIYRLALDLVQKAPQECCFIDDREQNLEPATHLGMQVIHVQNAMQLRADLQKFGVNI